MCVSIHSPPYIILYTQRESDTTSHRPARHDHRDDLDELHETTTTEKVRTHGRTHLPLTGRSIPPAGRRVGGGNFRAPARGVVELQNLCAGRWCFDFVALATPLRGNPTLAVGIAVGAVWSKAAKLKHYRQICEV
jgi:hypothetical protein